MEFKVLMLVISVAVVHSATQPEKRSTLPWDTLPGWNSPPSPPWQPAQDLSSDVAGAVAAAKAAARAVMAAQEQVAAAKHAALEQQSIASAKESAAALAAHKSEEAARHARAHALEAAQAAVHAQAQLAGAKARAAAAQRVAAAREAAAARAIQRAAHNQAARLENADIEALKLSNLNFKDKYVPRGVTYHDYSILMDPNPIKTALNVCKDLIAHRVYAVVVSHPLTGDLSPAAVSYTSGFYHIPVIGISSRDSAFSDKNIHVSFLRTVPPYSHQADVWVDVLKHFNYMKVIIIHSSDTDGRAILGRFQTTSQSVDEDVDRKVVVEQVIEFEPGLDSFADKLADVKSAQARVFLMYASKTDAEIIFRDATFLNMTTAGYVWMVTEQALDAANAPEGLLGLRLVNATNEHAHIQDSIYVLASAIRDMNTSEEIHAPPSDCDNSGSTWNTGRLLFDYVRKQSLESGATGHVAFDDHGDRVHAEYDMVNVRAQGEHVAVGKYFYSKETQRMRLELKENEIIWMGRSTSKPEGFMIPTHLKVLTIEEKPFVYARHVELETDCTAEEIPCPHFNATDSSDKMYCCKGFCIDLLRFLSKDINFTYSLALSPDGQFGNYIIRNLSAPGAKKEWTGLIGELVYERADMIVAPLTINPERAEFIEFSKPFKYQGITILEKKPSRSSTLVSFLQPFSNTLWILVMVSVHVVALVLYLLDRFSPFGRFKLANIDGTEEDALNLSSAIWFAWGVLLNSGIGEGTPRSFSARVLGMVWAGFAMIIVASYTANLAAFLVLERPKTKLTGINDARLRNTMENLTCATVKGSAVDMYFRRQVELSNMYRTMEANNYDNAEQAIEDVKQGKLMAFIWDSSRLEFEAAQDCELVTAGELFGRSGYGVGLQKGSPWADSVTLAILNFHESGIMESLDNQWILRNNMLNCEENEKTPNTLGLKNMAGVFILVLAGIIGGIVLIVIEVVYKRHQIKKQKRLEIARHAADRWRGAVEKRKTLRAAILPSQRRAKSNGIGKRVVTLILPRKNKWGNAARGVVGGGATLATAKSLPRFRCDEHGMLSPPLSTPPAAAVNHTARANMPYGLTCHTTFY
ncbi:receptor family ligand binding region domain-containing protein [Phthorimaea operculella]|nr:receptor family ligand binding region domain-containing protein [Phthorimaea operculella]